MRIRRRGLDLLQLQQRAWVGPLAGGALAAAGLVAGLHAWVLKDLTGSTWIGVGAALALGVLLAASTAHTTSVRFDRRLGVLSWRHTGPFLDARGALELAVLRAIHVDGAPTHGDGVSAWTLERTGGETARLELPARGLLDEEGRASLDELLAELERPLPRRPSLDEHARRAA